MVAQIPTSFSNFLEIFGAFFAELHFFGLLDFEVADVFDLMAELLDARLQASAAKGGRAHIHAAAALAEVHGNADDANFLRHVSLVFRDPWPVSREETKTHTTRRLCARHEITRRSNTNYVRETPMRRQTTPD